MTLWFPEATIVSKLNENGMAYKVGVANNCQAIYPFDVTLILTITILTDSI